MDRHTRGLRHRLLKYQVSKSSGSSVYYQKQKNTSGLREGSQSVEARLGSRKVSRELATHPQAHTRFLVLNEDAASALNMVLHDVPLLGTQAQHFAHLLVSAENHSLTCSIFD